MNRTEQAKVNREIIGLKNYAKSTANPVLHSANSDEQDYTESYCMNFTKGLIHDSGTGLVADTNHYKAFVAAIDSGEIAPFHALPIGTVIGKNRVWESPTAGYVFDTQGPDAQSVTMPPAPALGSDELTFEMAEVYELAILRDEPFSHFRDDDADNQNVQESCNRLNFLPYLKLGSVRRPRRFNSDTQTLTPGSVFRGVTPGAEVGPYLSCFMLMGGGYDAASVKSGIIPFGAQQINQRVPIAVKQDSMTTFEEFVKVQNGEKRNNKPKSGSKFYELNGDKSLKYRFIRTPRDMATYVHIDALYQAYLNACLILLSQKDAEGIGLAPFDPLFAELSGEADGSKAGGFALFGAPHILSLVTEVATRALKAVRFQKFNTHRRLRPEALAARIAKAGAPEFVTTVKATANGHFEAMKNALEKTLARLADSQGDAYEKGLLPMAFAEGSPMHTSYGAGHATVAGACVTILKAFFDTSTVLKQFNQEGKTVVGFVDADHSGDCVEIIVDDNCDELIVKAVDYPLTLEGELNKLAANIAIGRDMGGVHYYVDYYDSLLMGEEVAIGMLQDQAQCYPKDAFVMSLTKFDGTSIIVS